MPQALRQTLLSARDLLATIAPFLLLAIGLAALAYRALDPTPPQRVVLATGVDQGAYAEFGKRYAAALAKFGVTVELRKTQGSAENLALLRNPKSDVDIAFVQGGADEDATAQGSDDNAEPGLVSLGSMFYEPVWLFYRTDSARRLLQSDTLASLSQLPGWKLNIGAPGSGVPVLLRKLIEANKLQPASLTLTQLTQTPAVMALLDGSSDALVFASAPESLMVQMLLQTPGVRLFDFAQAEAYSRQFPFMSPVTLPRGVVDLARDLPPQDVRLVAPTATLLARAELHPALVQLFMQAAQQVHGGAGWFQRKGDFPSATNSERPLADEAQRFYQSGAPLLQRYLPFWLANLIDRMWPALLTLLAVLIPLSRMLPPVYEFRVRSRIFRWYGQLREIEAATGKRPAHELMRELATLDARVEGIAVPLAYADELYALRAHISLVRRRLLGTPEVTSAAVV